MITGRHLRKMAIAATVTAFMNINLFGGEVKTYPTDGKGDKVLGYKKLENSFGITTSYEGNTVYVNRSEEPLERVFGATEDGKEKVEVMKNNTVIVDGGILATNGYWDEKGEKKVRGGSVYGAAGQASDVTGNTVIIKGNSNIGGNVYGGYSHRGSAVNNKVIIEGTPTFGTETILFGGRGSRNVNLKEDKVTLAPFDVVSGNVLEIGTKNIAVKDIKNFEKIVFNIDMSKVKSKDRFLILTNALGVELEMPEIVRVSEKLELPESEKEKILKKKNKEFKLNIDVVLQNLPNKNIKNMKVILINAENGIKLNNLPENIDVEGKGYKYEIKFEKDSKNLYALISLKIVK